jgi:YkoP domain
VAYLDLSRAVRGVDSLLRYRHGIQEFTEDAQCIFRIAVMPAPRAVRLSDGTAVAEGDLVLQLHFWNEHLPMMNEAGPSAAWASMLKRRIHHSLAVVAAHIEHASQFDAIKALHGSPPFGSRLGTAQMVRTGQRFGFDVIERDAPPELRERIHDVFDSMFLWGLAYTFNPAALRNKGLMRHRYQLWISRAKLLHRYGRDAARH